MFLSRHAKGHGIHSPFIFDLVSRVFRNKCDKVIVFSIEKARKKLIKNKNSIIVTDLGTGSEKRKTNIRKVSEIARYSAVPHKYGVLLSNLAAEFGKPLIIELGTSFGISTMYMASSCREVPVWTIEGCPASADIAGINFNLAGLTNIRLLTGSFDSMFSSLTESGIKPGLVFIDGDHRKKSLMKNFKKIAELSDKKTVIVIDDIYDSREMSEAWEEIKMDERVTLTLDIYRMGIVFFREGISRNNYIIRY